MQDVILNFIRIQKLEETILEAQKVADDAPVQLGLWEEKVGALEKEHLDLKTSIAANQTQQKMLEVDLLKLKELKEGNKVRLTKADNDKTYKAILKEGDTIAQRTKEKEDESLALMEELDKLNAKLPPLEALLNQIKGEFTNERKKILESKDKAAAVIAESSKERQGLLSSIEPKYAEQYLYASTMRPGMVMAPVADATCLICHMRIPPQLYNELQRNDKLMLCPNCHRIMYWRDHPAWAPPAPALEEITEADNQKPKKRTAKKKATSAQGKDWSLADAGYPEN